MLCSVCEGTALLWLRSVAESRRRDSHVEQASSNSSSPSLIEMQLSVTHPGCNALLQRPATAAPYSARLIRLVLSPSLSINGTASWQPTWILSSSTFDVEEAAELGKRRHEEEQRRRDADEEKRVRHHIVHAVCRYLRGDHPRVPVSSEGLE